MPLLERVWSTACTYFVLLIGAKSTSETCEEALICTFASFTAIIAPLKVSHISKVGFNIRQILSILQNKIGIGN